jgi:hypothetical protein
MEQREGCKERYENFIQLITGKLEETTPKRKTKTISEMEENEK